MLLEAGEEQSYKALKDYIDSIDDRLKVQESVYRQRIACCKKCDNLISGMCVKCGCYAEMRAALKDMDCPDADDRKWKKEEHIR